MSYLLIDTDILIDVANNDSTAKGRLAVESHSSVLAVSPITVMELTVGCRKEAYRADRDEFRDSCVP